MTQKKMILRYLMHHKKGISQLEASDLYDITRLSAVVFDLRKLGYEIYNVKYHIDKPDGTRRYFVRYVLDLEASEKALDILGDKNGR